jgi:diguanylate cyclase (GGDEF)-like protein
MKKITIILTSIILIAIIFIFNRSMKDFFVKNNEIIRNLNMLQQHEYGLNYYLLKSTTSLYYNNDNISNEIKQMKEHIKFLTNNRILKQLNAYNYFLKYKKALHNKVQLIYKFEKYNLPIKNSLVFLTDLNAMLPAISAPKKYKIKTAKILSNIFLVKNATDQTFFKNINIKYFENAKIKDKNFNRSLVLNIKVFTKYFPKYNMYLKEILNMPTKKLLDKTINEFVFEINQKMNKFEIFAYGIVLFILIVMGIMLWLVSKLENDFNIIKKLTYKDYLTDLDNRFKFEEDIKKNQYDFLAVFNIDHFKTYNDYFGSQIGDKILSNLAQRLKKVVPHYYNNYELYRFGADEFGVLVKGEINRKAIESIITHLEMPLKIDDLEFTLSFSAGIADEKPFLEKADLALKEAKKDFQTKVKCYQENFNKEVAINFNKLEILKKAIDRNEIIPVFQPIYDNKTNEIAKYEVLSRLRVDGRLESIWPYLDVAKENKLYHHITKAILKEAFEIIKTKNKHLSINFSMQDLENEEILGYLFLNLNEENGKYLTIELLESEAINDYTMLKDFIKKVKKFNVEIAIDDFGSGYSNFARILNLNVDIIKIDGSLIKDIHKDKNSEMITKLIVEFAKNANIKIIAEFVHNQEVLDKVKELDIDMSQGFHLSAPIENI